MDDRYEWVRDTSAAPMEPDEVAAARGRLGMTQVELGEAVGAAKGAQQHISRAERDIGLRGCQAKIVRLLLDAKGKS